MKRITLIIVVLVSALACAQEAPGPKEAANAQQPDKPDAKSKKAAKPKTKPLVVAEPIDPETVLPITISLYQRTEWNLEEQPWGKTYRAMYKDKSGDVLEISINQSNDDTFADWDSQFKGSKRFKSLPMKMAGKPGKLTMMLRPATNLRVDFTTRSKSKSTLTRAAAAFDFARLKDSK